MKFRKEVTAHIALMAIGLYAAGCAAFMPIAKGVLSVIDQECAWRAPSTDMKFIKDFCRINDAAEPLLTELVSAKVSAQRAGVLRESATPAGASK